MEKIKTPEEMLMVDSIQHTKIGFEGAWYLSEKEVINAMLEYGRQQYAKGQEAGRFYYNRSEVSLKRKVTFDQIEKAVCNFFNVSPEDIEKKKRDRKVVFPRQVCHHLATRFGIASDSEIGYRFGRKDRTTVMHSVKTIKNLLDTDKVFRLQYEELLSKFQTELNKKYNALQLPGRAGIENTKLSN